MKLFRYLLFIPFIAAASAYAELASQLIAKGFERPVWVGSPDSAEDKIWILEQAGTVWIVDLESGERSDVPFLDITEQVTRKGNEQGLLGLAFAPDFETSGRYYVNFNEKGGDSRVVRFVSKDRNTTDPDSGETILKYEQPYGNHNGGWLGFGPDGYLYVATGDGGSANDPKNYAQDMGSLLGKLLRIDVSGETGYKIPADNPYLNNKAVRPEIVAIGLRNPWRCSFDRVTGDFWIGDVGQNAWEEIDMVRDGEIFEKNFGWRLREGAIKTPKKGIGGAEPENNHEPVYVYKHGSGPTEGLSVTGGYVYRGSKIKGMQGRYIFADYQNPRIWSFELKEGKATGFRDHTSELQPESGRISLIPTFGEDAAGELYLADLTGAVYRIVGR